MNISHLGPRVGLAPAADPAEGKLDVVVAEASGRGALVAALRTLFEGEPESTLGFTSRTRRTPCATIG